MPAMPSFAIGVDLGGTNLRIAAVDEQGTLLEKVTLGTQVARGRDYVISEMCDAIRELAAKFSRSGRMIGAGIGIPGIIDKRTGMLRESPNLPGWENYPVRNEIEQRLGAPVMLENDANAAAFGEAWLGAARGQESMCMITLGTGVGGGIVLDGKIWHGMTGMAGEVGHMTIDPSGPRCNCGNIGCVEQFASATAVMRMAREAIANGSAPELERAASASDVEFSAKVVYNLAIQGDQARARDLPPRRLGAGHLDRRPGEHAEPEHVRDRRRRCGGVERFQPGDVRGSEEALDGVRRHRARRTRCAAGRRIRGGRIPFHGPADHHYARAAGQRCRPLWRRASAHGRRRTAGGRGRGQAQIRLRACTTAGLNPAESGEGSKCSAG